MPACDGHLTMDEGAFAAHLKDLATQIKDTVADVAARTVFDDAEGVRRAVEYELYQIYIDKYNASDDPSSVQIPPTPPDKGYSLLDGHWKQVVDDYRSNYEIDLLTFDAADEAATRDSLKNEHLTWIVDLFDRGGGFPKPDRAEAPISTLEQTAGAESLLTVSQGEGGEIDINAATGNLGESMIGAAVTANISGVQDATNGWNSSTSKVFRTQFLPRIPTAAGNQINAIRAMRNLLGMHQGLMTKARGDIDAIAHDGLEAVESFDGCCGGGADITTILGVAGGVLAIAGGVATIAAGGTGIALVGAGIGILGGAVNTAKALDGAETEEFALGDSTLDGTIEKIKEAVDKTYTDLDSGYTELGTNGMAALASLMDSNPNLVRAPRPESGNGDGFGDATQENVQETVE